MQFTTDQIISSAVLALAITIYGYFSWHCGRRDKNEQIKNWKQKFYKANYSAQMLKTELLVIEQRATNYASSLELLNESLEAANSIKQEQLEATRFAEDIADAQHVIIKELRRKALSDAQRTAIKQAAAQMVMTAQLMDAIKNTEVANSQRKLIAQLNAIITAQDEPAISTEAA